MAKGEQIEEGSSVLLSMSMNDKAGFVKKIASTYALNNLYFNLFGLSKEENPDLSQKEAGKLAEDLKSEILKIMEYENDPILLDYYKQFPVFK